MSALQPLLSPDEAGRATRFRFPLDRDRFIIARAVLRILLGLYTDVSPVHLRFSYGPYGKPSLAGALPHGPVRFNLSHSRGLALYAVTRDREVGVDLEMIRADFGWRTVAGRLLSSGEIASISALPPEEQVQMFFTYWARKEALAKALGGGLALPLRQVELTGGRHGSPILVSAGEITGNAGAWRVQDLGAGLDLAAAVAVAGENAVLRGWQWEWEGARPAWKARSMVESVIGAYCVREVEGVPLRDGT